LTLKLKLLECGVAALAIIADPFLPDIIKFGEAEFNIYIV